MSHMLILSIYFESRLTLWKAPASRPRLDVVLGAVDVADVAPGLLVEGVLGAGSVKNLRT